MCTSGSALVGRWQAIVPSKETPCQWYYLHACSAMVTQVHSAGVRVTGPVSVLQQQAWVHSLGTPISVAATFVSGAAVGWWGGVACSGYLLDGCWVLGGLEGDELG